MQNTTMGNRKFAHLDKRDYLAIAILMIISAYCIFARLGSFVAPQTEYILSKETTKELVLDLGEEVEVDRLYIFLGREHKKMMTLSSYNTANSKWEIIKEDVNIQSVFAWNKVELKQKIRYLGIVTTDDIAYFNEIAIIGANDEVITPVNANRYPELFDEQAYVKAYPSYYDQTFFDEVYHARTANEFIHGYTTYETTHPPLGKIIISLGIRIFGMTPFGWRVMGALFGVMMVPLMYLFAKQLFTDSFVASMTTLLLCMDFMPLTLARISTLDIFIAFFIVLMYYFMYQYCRTGSFVSLGLCGMTMGIGIATKWTGVYAGAALAVIFFYTLWKQCKRNREEQKDLVKRVVWTLIFCMVFFVMIPMVIYCLSYIPFVEYTPSGGLMSKMLKNMESMYSYHSDLVATHPYESRWYEWPWMKVPLYQALAHNAKGEASVASTFGNPLVWWPGIVSVLYVFKKWLRDRDQKAAFLSVAYSAQLIPWMLVTRCTFIYHYFPCSLFTILCSGYCIKEIIAHKEKNKTWVIVYISLVVLTFIFFYPVLTGQWVDVEQAKQLYRWLPNWAIVS